MQNSFLTIINIYHTKLHLKMVTERRNSFMLMLMYKLSLDIENVNTDRPEMLLRTGPKVKMKVPFTEKEKVRHSPFYVCSRIWDKLDSSIQLSTSMYEFKNNLKKFNLRNL